jgi:hypothetical protein
MQPFADEADRGFERGRVQLNEAPLRAVLWGRRTVSCETGVAPASVEVWFAPADGK